MNSFLGGTTSCGEAKGGCENDVSLPTLPESISVASICVANLKAVTQVKALG